MNLKRHLKKILIGSVISVLSFMIILSAIVVAITSTMQSAGGAWYKLKQTNENTETEETESGDIQAGVIKGKRTSYPSGDNLFYFGANLNPWVSMGARPGYHNCTWYAFGRFVEILGKRPALPTGNAYIWYSHCTAYKKGKTPKVGALICWDYTNHDCGHVAIVEEVKSNGDIVVSQSGWRGGKFWMTNVTKASGYRPQGRYVFQGFIYQP